MNVLYVRLLLYLGWRLREGFLLAYIPCRRYITFITNGNMYMSFLSTIVVVIVK